MSQQKRARKPGRPRLPKGEAKGRIVPVRFRPDDLRALETAAKASKQTVSERIRSIVGADMDEWKIERNGRVITFTYKEIGRNTAEMTARTDGEEFTQLLKKTGLTLPLRHEDVENMFARAFPR